MLLILCLKLCRNGYVDGLKIKYFNYIKNIWNYPALKVCSIIKCSLSMQDFETSGTEHQWTKNMFEHAE